ncbi:MAG TPA: hypothetical protein VMR14_12630 [Streptosporangiaceae bacterium]|nr:hypothetical protein [Streptosporangiaceae bacterium]
MWSRLGAELLSAGESLPGREWRSGQEPVQPGIPGADTFVAERDV